MRDLLNRTAEIAARYLETLDARSVTPTPEALAGLAELHHPQQGGAEILNEVVLNQVLVAFGDAARTRQVIERVQQDGTCWCGPTAWQGRTAMRISVSSWATEDEDVDRSVAAILRVSSA